MKANNLTIIPPEGMEAYQEDNEIKFRPIEKKLTYEEIVIKFKKYPTLYGGDMLEHFFNNNTTTTSYIEGIISISKKQIQKLIAINKLMNVAKYLNDGWQPNWDNAHEYKYYLRIDNKKIKICWANIYSSDIVYFKSEELAKQATNILGEETIKLALSTDW